MKKLVLFIVAVLSIAFCANLCAATLETKAEENRQVKSFERIRLYGSPDIKYSQGKTCTVRVKGDANIIKNVETRVEDNCLIVNLKNPKVFSVGFFKNQDVTVYVTSPDIIGVEVLGSGDFESKGLIDTDNLEVVLRGSGDINFENIICDRIKTSLVGSGDIDIKNVTTQQTSVELVGSGDVKIRQKNARETKLQLKGSGDIKVDNVNCGSMECRLVGSGDITLTGNVRKLSKTTRGSGEIHTGGLKVSSK